MGPKRLSIEINEQINESTNGKLSLEIHNEIQIRIKRGHKNTEGNNADAVNKLKDDSPQEALEGTKERKEKATVVETGVEIREEDEVVNENMGEETDKDRNEDRNEEITDEQMAIIDEKIRKIELATKYLINLIHKKIKIKKKYLPDKKYGFYDYRDGTQNGNLLPAQVIRLLNSCLE